jgi:hypothetical protein
MRICMFSYKNIVATKNRTQLHDFPNQKKTNIANTDRQQPLSKVQSRHGRPFLPTQSPQSKQLHQLDPLLLANLNLMLTAEHLPRATCDHHHQIPQETAVLRADLHVSLVATPSLLTPTQQPTQIPPPQQQQQQQQPQQPQQPQQQQQRWVIAI